MMAILSKEQYERRRENAAIRAVNNEEIAQNNGMTEEQAEMISELCSLRHEIHCNAPIQDDESGFKNKLVELNRRIKMSGLAHMTFIPIFEDEYIDIDTIAELHERDGHPECGTDEYDEWIQDEKMRINSELEKLNEKIEEYLRIIDKRYGTVFAPTGMLRL